MWHSLRMDPLLQFFNVSHSSIRSQRPMSGGSPLGWATAGCAPQTRRTELHHHSCHSSKGKELPISCGVLPRWCVEECALRMVAHLVRVDACASLLYKTRPTHRRVLRFWRHTVSESHAQ